MTNAELKFMEMVQAQLREIAKQLSNLNENMAHMTDQKETAQKTSLVKEPTQYADNANLSVELYHKNGKFGAYLSDDRGGSGISVDGTNPEKVAITLAQYNADYFYKN